MIQISGSHRRTFVFPAELPLAFTYYSDLGRVLPYLPHIFLVQAYRYDQFRMLYSTVELGMYQIRIFCDLEARLDDNTRTLFLQPLKGYPPAKPAAGSKSATGQGFFFSQSVFQAAGRQTKVDYNLQLQADLLSPLGLRLMPGGVVNRIAHNITRRRIREIADGFIERSIDAFPYWVDELQQENLPAL